MKIAAEEQALRKSSINFNIEKALDKSLYRLMESTLKPSDIYNQWMLQAFNIGNSMRKWFSRSIEKLAGNMNQKPPGNGMNNQSLPVVKKRTWNMTISTDKKLEHNSWGITILLKEGKEWIFVDIAVTGY